MTQCIMSTLFTPDSIHQVITCQSSSDVASSSSSNNRPFPPPTINLAEDNGVQQMQPSFLFVPIQEGSASERATSPYSGCETPLSITDAKPDSKPTVKGGEKGAVAFTLDEHVAVLQPMLLELNAFNASERSVEWRKL
jgi:hypothetical protein